MIAGDPDAVVAAAAALARSSGFTDAATGIDAAATAALSGWEGQAAAAAGATSARFGPALATADEACRALVPALRAYAAELRAAQEQFARAQTAADQVVAPSPAAPAVGVLVTADEATRGMDAAVERARVADERAAAAVAEAQRHLAAMTVGRSTPAGTTPVPVARPEADEPGLLNTLGHTALDLVGLVPVVGEAADVANAAWYGLEGDYAAAGLSLAAAIPIAGWAFTGGKLGFKGVDTVKAVTDAGGAAAWVKGRPSMVPWSAERLPYKGVGEAYRWSDPATGKTVRYHAHPTDSTAPVGSHSASGPTYRLKVGNHHLDAEGTRYSGAQLAEGSARYSAQGANNTHIPYPTNQPVGWEPGHRVFVPNAASLADGTGEDGGSAR